MLKPLPTVKTLSFALVVLLSSCSKKNSLDSENFTTRHKASFSICATIEPRNKSVIADEYGALEWNSGDSIAVFGLVEDSALKMVCEQKGRTADFKAEGPFSRKGALYALYPYNSNATINGDVISTVLPENQIPVINSYDPYAFLSAGKDVNSAENDLKAEIGFYNICGGLRFTVSRSDIVKVEFQGNNGEPLAGDVKINLSSAVPATTPADAWKTKITLSSNSTLVPPASSDNGESQSWYYISFLPQVLSKGFTLTFYCSNGSSFNTVCNYPVTFTRSNFSSLRQADLQQSVDDIVTGEDLSYNCSRIANCYIVNKEGYFKIPLVSMDEPDKFISDAKTATVIWETYNTDERPEPLSLIDNLRIKGDYLYFHVSGEAIGKGGNALVGVHDDDSGNAIWSWHLWICKGFEPTGSEIMDRNLGALDSSPSAPLSTGLFYQWGRKDPFPGASSSGNQMKINWEIFFKENTSNSRQLYFHQLPWHFGKGDDWLNTKYVDNSLWAEDKGKAYDPCPYGWKVPSSEQLANLDAAVLPMCGYINKDGAFVDYGKCARIWSSTPDDSKSSSLDISSGNPSSNGITPDFRSEGHSIRCIKQ